MRSTTNYSMTMTMVRPQKRLIYLFIFASMCTGLAVSIEVSTILPANRGAARQMYGSGSLRQTGSGPVIVGTTTMPVHRGKDGHDTSNDMKHDEKSLGPEDLPEHHEEYPHESHGPGYDISDAWSRRPGQIPRNQYHPTPGIFPRIPGQPSDNDNQQPGDVPSYRNGAPVNGMRMSVSNGGIYGQGRPGGGRGGAGSDWGNRGRTGVHGGFSAGGVYGEGHAMPDRSRINNGLERGHGIGSVGEADPERFGPDQKTLIQELEDEGDLTEAAAPCGWICAGDQFLCAGSCTCVNMKQRCDGTMDCGNGEDEINCEEVLEERRINESCYADRNRRCPTSGYCIFEFWICDGDDDCGDNSDEATCGYRMNCTDEHQFQCKNGLCVQQGWLCDGDNDCMDYSDEEDCADKKKCKEYEFTCPDGTCILNDYRCDGDYDCRDGSDESKCQIFQEVHCGENYFECTTPRCIKMEYQCDGDDDCGDASDEENCPNAVESCPANHYRCVNGDCIIESKMCDGKKDCPNGDDETQPCEIATPKPCSPTDEYLCDSGPCVSRSWVCDGVLDCPNGDDEEHCALTCDVTQYLCKSPSALNETTAVADPSHPTVHHFHSYCISNKHVCDGLPDCPEQDDEVDCPRKRECTATDRCTQRCILTASNQKACACEFGFVLGPDNATCNDVNECEFEKDPVCSQLCNNTLGSFACGCMRGYVLRPDSRTCKAIGANLMLLFTNRVDIRKMTLGPPKQSKHTPILKGLHVAIALDYHYKRETVYWSDVAMDVIRKVYINGSDPEDVLRWGLDTPGGVAIDWIHDLLFWTDAGTRRIEVITLDTKVRHVLISSDLGKPRAIAVHPHYGWVFWTDWGSNPKIERADMDGTGRTALVTESISWPNGLTIDYTTDRIFWTDARPAFIESAHLDGSGRKKILSKGLWHPFAITVFEDFIYWTDWHFKSISSANKVNGRLFKTIYSGLHFPMDLHSYHPQRQPDYPNHCGDNNGKCSHMCLPNSAGYSCVCPVGLKIKRDGKNCATTADNLLIFARKRDLRMIPIDQATRAFDTVIPVDHVQSAVALTWDSNEDTIYWTDVEADSISRAHLNGTNQTVIINHNLESPAGLAMDWITNKLYWTDAGTNRIECSNLDGTMRTLLIHEDLDKPRDIVVDPIAGYMYWSDWGTQAKIERALMDGTERKVLISANLTWPNGLAIDFEKKRLYWADGGTKTIEHSDLDGKDRTVLVEAKLPHPFGLVIHKNKIYWTDWDTQSIHRADKDTGGNVTVVRSEIKGLMDVRAFHRNRRMTSSPCNRNNGNCSHLCLVSKAPRRFKCACPTGLVIASDGRTCPDMPSKFLVLAHRVDIRVLSLDVNYRVDVALPLPYLKNASGVDVNRRNADVYWTDPGEDVIKKTTFDGSRIETIIDTGIDTVDSLVVDSIGRKLYWTDAGLNSIEVSELDGNNRKVLVWSGLDSPRAIVLHYVRGLMFWSDWGLNARIERANMDGEERTTIVAEDLVWPNGIAIDYMEDRLYWTDAKRKVIESSDLDGNDRRVIVKNVRYPYGIAVMGEYIYWSDWNSRGVVQAKKTSGDDRKVIVDTLDGVMDIRAISWLDMHVNDNSCENDNGGCSHLCLRNPTGYSCACPTGILLNDDKKTCEKAPSNFLLFAARKSLARMSFDTPEMWEVALPVPDVHRALSVDFHWARGQILYTDTNTRAKGFMIRSVNMQNYSDAKTIIAGSESISPFSVAVDWIADNLYWTDMKHKVVSVARIDGTSQKTIVSDLEDPRSLALFPRLGYVFWTEWGDHAKIQRALLDGSGRKNIVSTNLAFPNGLSIDYANRKLFWADSLKDRIETSDLHGRYRVTLVSGFIDPFGLTQYGEHIYWANWKQEMVQRADKATGENRVLIRTLLGFMTDLKSISADRQTGWNPCAIENGGCTHLCLFARKSYKCACPEKDDPNCSTVPKKQIPLRKPGSENDPNAEELDDDEPKVPESVTRNNHRDGDDKFKNYRNNKNSYSWKTVMTTVALMVICTVAIVAGIIYLLCQRKTKQEKYMQYADRQNVRTFSNPNYNASSADGGPCNPQQEKKSFIWKRLKYDSSQERVYEDNGPTSSPEVVSLIPPSATPSSSRAPSITPRESSPSLTHINHLNG